jgi:hypothetical protein
MTSQGDTAEDLMVEGSETAQVPVIDATINFVPGLSNEIIYCSKCHWIYL